MPRSTYRRWEVHYQEHSPSLQLINIAGISLLGQLGQLHHEQASSPAKRFILCHFAGSFTRLQRAVTNQPRQAEQTDCQPVYTPLKKT